MINFIKMIYQTLKCNIQTVLQEPKKKTVYWKKKKWKTTEIAFSVGLPVQFLYFYVTDLVKIPINELFSVIIYQEYSEIHIR